MIAEQFLIRGIELVGFVLVILAIGRNAVSSRLRERDPMRMSVRDLTAWLAADRVGSGKHVLRNIKLVRLAGPLIDLRTRLLAQNRPDAWLRTFEQTVYALRSITERIDVYDQTKREMRGSERRAARRAIRADAAGLVTWIHDMRRAAGRPLPHEAERTPLGMPPAGDGAPLAEPMRRRIAEITRSATDALQSLPESDMSEARFTLRETIDRYLPDTLAAYAKLATIDRAAADAELEPQIRIIEESTQATVAALRDGRLTDLTANGIFLRERLAADQVRRSSRSR